MRREKLTTFRPNDFPVTPLSEIIIIGQCLLKLRLNKDAVDMHRCYCGESACVSACTCRCDSGGDCECLCTAVAAFASECDRHGVYVKWRNQHFCRTSCSFWARPVCYQTVFCLSILSRPSVLSVTFVYCGQTVGWIQMKLGMQVGLVPDHIVLDEDPAPLLQKGGRVPPIFGPFLL